MIRSWLIKREQQRVEHQNERLARIIEVMTPCRTMYYDDVHFYVRHCQAELVFLEQRGWIRSWFEPNLDASRRRAYSISELSPETPRFWRNCWDQWESS